MTRGLRRSVLTRREYTGDGIQTLTEGECFEFWLLGTASRAYEQTDGVRCKHVQSSKMAWVSMLANPCVGSGGHVMMNGP